MRVADEEYSRDSWLFILSVLKAENKQRETRTITTWSSTVPGENHQLVANHWQTFSHNIVSNAEWHVSGCVKLTILVVIGTDCTGSCNPTTIRSRLWWPLEEIFDIECMLMKIMYTISNWPFFQVLELLYIIQTQHSNHVTTPAAVIGWYTFGWTNYSDTNKDVIIDYSWVHPSPLHPPFFVGFVLINLCR